MKEQKNKDYLGLSKNINDYYNHYVSVADAKAGAVIVITFVVLDFLMKMKPFFFIEKILFYSSGLLLVMSGLFSLLVVFPRTPKNKKGIIFWENVRLHKNSNEYYNSIKNLSKNDIEKKYANQNFNLSNLLHTKHNYIKAGITTLISALIFITILYLILIPNI